MDRDLVGVKQFVNIPQARSILIPRCTLPAGYGLRRLQSKLRVSQIGWWRRQPGENPENHLHVLRFRSEFNRIPPGAGVATKNRPALAQGSFRNDRFSTVIEETEAGGAGRGEQIEIIAIVVEYLGQPGEISLAGRQRNQAIAH